jgi:ABC-type transport system substrate-binding protein
MVNENLGTEVPVVINGADQFRGQFNLLRNVRDLGYNPEKATAILNETGNNGLSLWLLILPDERLQNTAEILQASLTKIGVQSEIMVVPEADMSSTIQSLMSQDLQLMIIEYR